MHCPKDLHETLLEANIVTLIHRNSAVEMYFFYVNQSSHVMLTTLLLSRAST